MTATSCTTSSFVYLKSFKELFLFRGFRLLSKAFAKLGAFFETAKLFRKFFFKKFFLAVEADFVRLPFSLP